MYFDYTLFVFILPAMLFALYAQGKIQSNYNRYSQVFSQKGYTGRDCARMILDQNGLTSVAIEQVQGNLTDHYDPRSNVVRLSQGVYNSTSIAAIGVAAHECGHAIQHATGYAPLKFRNSIIPITNIGSRAALPILLVGMLLGSDPLIILGIIAFSLMAVFQLITLPVEFNASNRALQIIDQKQMLVGEELTGAKKVLQAAALTYVAALASALAQLLRLISLTNRRRNN